jgi:hypothetical protein
MNKASQRLALAAVGGEGRLAVEAETTQSQTNAKITRRVPTVRCTLCWAEALRRRDSKTLISLLIHFLDSPARAA